MANWCNLRLVVTGRPADVVSFRRAAGERRGRIDISRSEVFTTEMAFGEGRSLEADSVRPFRRAFQRVVYLFQGRNDDHADHFGEVSHRFPALALVLVFSDPNVDIHGSHLFLAGKHRTWVVPVREKKRLLRIEYKRYGTVTAAGRIDYDAPGANVAEWEAFWRMMDVAERHWNDQVLDWLCARRRL